MSYSRRQLYAMGEPIGDSATYRKADGGLILGGGGSNTPPANTTQTSTTELPEWARGYAKDTLYQASLLTDPNKNPYKTYNQERIAGFSPMQEQAQQGAANMQPNQGINAGMDMAARVGAQSFTRGNTAANFMSPYMQNVVDIQKREAGRQSSMQGTQQQAQAAQAGAFGGSRDAIMRAERERNLGQQMNDIQATGSQNAFQQAQQQFNMENQTGLQAAGQLGALGQTQYGQQMGINQLQNQYGAQQQALKQQGLSQGYQDFLNQQNDPYKRLGYMSDMVRGMPLGQQSTQSIYQAPPSMMQNVAAAGMGIYGAKQLGMFGEGGQVKGYAGGGELNPMDDLNRMTAAVSKLSDEQLQQVIQRPSSAAQKQAAQLELATRASEKQGLASAYNAMPMAAGGGMVAFGKGGIMHFQDAGQVNDPFAVDSDYAETNDAMEDQTSEQRAGNPAAQAALHTLLLKKANEVGNAAEFKDDGQTEEQGIVSNMAMMNRLAGPSPMPQIQKQISNLTSQARESLEQGKGLAALNAMGAILKGPNFMSALGGAGTAFADSYKDALAANQKAKNSIAQMNINLLEGQRAEKLGQIKDASVSYRAAKKYKLDAYKAQQEADAKGLIALSKAEKAVQPPRPYKPAAPAKLSPYMEYVNADAATRVLMERFAGITHPAPIAADIAQAGQTARQVPEMEAKQEQRNIEWAKSVNDEVNKRIGAIGISDFGRDPEYRKDPVKYKLELAKRIRADVLADPSFQKPASISVAPAAPAAAPATPKPKPITELPPGTTYGKVVPGKGTEAILNGKVIGYVN